MTTGSPGSGWSTPSTRLGSGFAGARESEFGVSGTLAAWLTEHPQVTTVVRDASTTYAEAVRRARPAAIQVSDRWHLWHGLAQVVERAVAAHGRWL
nr:transposase [Nocardia wallacei]